MAESVTVEATDSAVAAPVEVAESGIDESELSPKELEILRLKQAEKFVVKETGVYVSRFLPTPQHHHHRHHRHRHHHHRHHHAIDRRCLPQRLPRRAPLARPRVVSLHIRPPTLGTSARCAVMATRRASRAPPSPTCPTHGDARSACRRRVSSTPKRRPLPDSRRTSSTLLLLLTSPMSRRWGTDHYLLPLHLATTPPLHHSASPPPLRLASPRLTASPTSPHLPRGTFGTPPRTRYGFGTNEMTADQKNGLIFGGIGAFFLLFLSGYLLE